jgi:uncharacterized protein YcbX
MPAVRVTELWRFPVKSLQGERLDAVEVTERGLAGDRAWALQDGSTGLFLTARREPELLFAAARLDDDGAALITLPDGPTAADDGALSAWLGRPVKLVPAATDLHGTYEIALSIDDEEHAEWVTWDGPDGSFHDSTRARVSLVTEATMGSWDRRRFRMNVIADGEDEESMVGNRIRVGAVEIDVQKPIDRCVMTTRPQPAEAGGQSIDRDLSVLKTINAERGGNLGIGGLVATPGLIAIGDEIGPV